MNLEKALLKYNRYGSITEWFTKSNPTNKGQSGFGFIVDYETQRRFFTHYSSHKTEKTRNERTYQAGKMCLFVTGTHPQKENEVTLSFVLADELDKEIAAFQNQREIALRECDNNMLNHILKAEWYLRLWKEKKDIPKLGLDKLLSNEIKTRLSNKEYSIPQRLNIIRVIKESKYELDVDIDETERKLKTEIELKKLFSKGLYSYCNENIKFNSLADTEKSNVTKIYIKHRALAIDIEADEDNIYQYGFSGGLISKIKLKESDLYHPLGECFSILENELYWLIGHNIVKWDIPRIRKEYPQISVSNIIWDTLFFSFLINPYKYTHALTNSKIAHNAESDAEAALNLFFDQIKLFPTKIIIEYDKGEFTFADRIKLAGVCLYNESFNIVKPLWLKDSDKIYVIPDYMLEQVHWVQNVSYIWPEGYNNLDDMYLAQPMIDTLLKKHSENIYLVILNEVMKRAAINQVQVLLRMIPLWIRNNIEEFIPELTIYNPTFELEYKVTTYNALRETYSPSKILNYLNSANTVCAKESWYEIIRKPHYLSLNEINSIREEEVVKKQKNKFLFFSKPPESGFMLKIDETPKEEEEIKYCRWIEYMPSLKKNIIRSPYRIFKIYKPEFEFVNLINEKRFFDIPQWTDFCNQRYDGIFLNPLSGNRTSYWEDLLSRFISLLNDNSFKNHHVVFLLEHPEELQVIQKILCDLNLTEIADKRSILRDLEYTFVKKKKPVYAGTIESSKSIIRGCSELGLNCKYVIESVPINFWSIFAEANTEEKISEDYTNKNYADEDEPADEAETEEDSPKEKGSKIELHVSKSNELNNWKEYLDEVLDNWSYEITGFADDSIIPIIMDVRLSRSFLGKSTRLKYFNCLYQNNNTETKRIIHRYCADLGHIERSEAPSDYKDYIKFLKQNWGFSDFKASQVEPVKAIIGNNQDVIVRMPTGEGKSLVFQVPALRRSFNTKRLNIVISPLRALILDQVERLWKEGFYLDVDYLSGDREFWENNQVYQHIVDGQIKLLYVAPERLRIQKFKEAIYRRFSNDEGFEFIIFDEAHCISQWGYEFRPDYLYAINDIVNNYRVDKKEDNTNFVFLSATITDKIHDDIIRIAKLNLNKLAVIPRDIPHPIRDFIKISSLPVDGGLYRENSLVERVGLIEKEISQANFDKSTVVVFCTRREHTEELAKLLHTGNKSVKAFHAGLPADERLDIYDELKAGKLNVLVCTKAFGMGLDISNIHWCVHLAPPTYLEDYLQEVGRTGRGKEEREKAGLDEIQCFLLWNEEDFAQTRILLERNKIEPHDLTDLMAKILKYSQKFADNSSAIAVIPNEFSKKYEEDKYIKSLYWLEKSNRIQIIGKLPNIIKVSGKRSALKNISTADTVEGKIARLIMNALDNPVIVSPNKNGENESIVKKIFNVLANTIGFIVSYLGMRDQTNDIQESDVFKENVEDFKFELNLTNLYQDAGLQYIDDAFRVMGSLQKKNCLQILNPIKLKKGKYGNVNESMWRWLNVLISKYITPTQETGGVINEEQLEELLLLERADVDKWGTNQRYRLIGQKRCLRSLLLLLSSLRIKIAKTLNEENIVIYKYYISQNQYYAIINKTNYILNISKKLFELFNKEVTSDTSLPLGKILEKLSEVADYKISDLKTALKLLSRLGLYTTENDILQWNYVLEVKDDTPFPNNIDDPSISENDKEYIEEIKETNTLATLRSFVFEIFSLTPPELKKLFIDEYFKLGSNSDLENFIVRQAGSLQKSHTHLENELRIITQRVQGEAYTKEYELLSDEQKIICTTHSLSHVLVNAGPGAGKTRVLVMRAAYLIHREGLQPESILILAFNRAVVFEIRSRINDLFRNLGFGNYASRLNVYTFNSFAMRNMDEINSIVSEDELGKVLHNFSKKVKSNREYAQSIMAGIRCIMVDEFQDMNEDFYDLITGLQDANNSGIMVIGDDDQDILMWNRIQNTNNNNPRKLHAYQYFKEFRQLFEDIKIFNLTVNYRSRTEIVSRSQSLLNKNSIVANSRIKTNIILKANNNAEENEAENKTEGNVKKVDSNKFEEKIREIREHYHNETIAVLCRTNSECYEVASTLDVLNIPNQIMGDADYKLIQIRNVGNWADKCEEFNNANNFSYRILTDSLFEEIYIIYQIVNLPLDQDIKILWDYTIKENPRATLTDHLKFLRSTKKSDLSRMLKDEQNKNIIVSTINKVKGLEFDIVYLKSSKAPFPLNGGNNIISNKDFALEEFRLYYVGMTRAKTNLYWEWEDREKEWRKEKDFTGTSCHQRILMGSLKQEFDLAWPARQYTDRQNYIENSVSVGDEIIYKDRYILHNNKKIGKLSIGAINVINNPGNSVSGLPTLKVCEVIRYPATQENRDIFNYQQKYVDQGWFYTVLVKGRL